MKRRNLQITLLTCAVHLCYLVLFPSFHLTQLRKQPKPPMKITMKEIHPPGTRTLQAIQEKRSEEQSPSFLPKTVPPQKKTIKNPAKKPIKKIQPQPPKQKKKTKPTTTSKQVKKTIKKKAPKPLQKSHPAPSLSPKTTTQVKPPPTTHAPFTTEGEDKHAYLQSISTQLQQWLTLPEKGSVKLTITVQPNGKIVNIKPLEVNSEKNLDYLQQILKGVQLPPYGKNEEITFIITFCDDTP